MEHLLWMDSIRGYHSTGVTSINGKGRTNDTLKLAVDGAYFTQTQGWADFLKNNRNKSKVLMGHNRWATSGAVNAENAHPFTHSHITMMHNGTLLDQTLLPDHQKFEVDSENIAYSLSVQGLEKTVEKLDGAYALVWHDSYAGTLNFFRNDERPLWFAKLKNNQGYAWASEKKMLEWLLTRSKKGLILEKMIELPVGEHFSIQVGRKGITEQEPVKYEIPTFSYNNYGYGFGWNRSYENKSSLAAKREDYQLLLENYLGYNSPDIEEEIRVIPQSFTPYRDSVNGTIRGYIDGFKNKGLVLLSNMTEVDWKTFSEFSAKISSVSDYQNELKVFTNNVKGTARKNGTVMAMPVLKITKDGTNLYEKSWQENYEHTCFSCGVGLSWNDVEDFTNLGNTVTGGGRNSVICKGCEEDLVSGNVH